MSDIMVGDVVAIRGDKRRVYLGGNRWRCAYTPDKLVQEKYLRHTGHRGVWLGRVTGIRGDMVNLNGACWGIEMVEVIFRAALERIA